MERKILLLGLCVFALVAYGVNAQVVSVNTDIQPKNAVIEDFTGIYCQYCPDGARRAELFSDTWPGRVVIIATHAPFYSGMGPNGEPDMATPFAAPLVAQSDLTGYPAATVNRDVFSGANNAPPYFRMMTDGLALSRSGWAAAGQSKFTETTPVNVGFESSWNSATRELTVKVYLFYSNTETVDNYINIALMENGIIGYQQDSDPMYGTTNFYVHDNTLRHYLTGQWGDKVAMAETVQGNKIQRTYTYTVPSNYVIENCDIAVFVSRFHVSINTAMRAKAIGGSTGLDTTGFNPGIQSAFTENTLSLYPNPAISSSNLVLDLGKTSDVEIEVYDILGAKLLTPFTGNVTAGTPKTIEINTSSFAPGIYFVKAKMGDRTETIRLTISR